MPRTANNTHGQVLSLAGGTTAAETSLGTITLPAGGPWNIFGAWVHCVSATMTPAEIVGGHVRIASPSGDITPNPAPIKIPTGYGPSQLGGTSNTQQSYLFVHDLDLVASGKSTLELFGQNDVAVTVAPQWCAGILYGLEIVESKAPHWYDAVRAGVTAATLSTIGTITLSEGATEIVSICAIISQGGVLTAGEELIGYVQLSSDDLLIQPLQIPVSTAVSAGLGATIGNGPQIKPRPIYVSIPVKGGARIDASLKLSTAVTNACSCKVIIGYR